MKDSPPRSLHRACRHPPVVMAVLALLALLGAGVAPAQVIGPGGVCATSRAQESATLWGTWSCGPES